MHANLMLGSFFFLRGEGAGGGAYRQGVTKAYRLSWLTHSALVYEPKCGGRGEMRAVSTNEYSCVHKGAQINFGEI